MIGAVNRLQLALCQLFRCHVPIRDARYRSSYDSEVNIRSCPVDCGQRHARPCKVGVERERRKSYQFISAHSGQLQYLTRAGAFRVTEIRRF